MVDSLTKIKRINKRREGANFLKTLLSDKRSMLYFAQPSSRTYLSHTAACQILGLDTMDVRDTKTSSEVKGESPEDTIRTFSSYVDMIIMRHPVGGFAERVAWMMAHTNREIPVLNAGSGADHHRCADDHDTAPGSGTERRGGRDPARAAVAGPAARRPEEGDRAAAGPALRDRNGHPSTGSSDFLLILLSAEY